MNALRAQRLWGSPLMWVGGWGHDFTWFTRLTCVTIRLILTAMTGTAKLVGR